MKHVIRPNGRDGVIRQFLVSGLNRGRVSRHRPPRLEPPAVVDARRIAEGCLYERIREAAAKGQNRDCAVPDDQPGPG